MTRIAANNKGLFKYYVSQKKSLAVRISLETSVRYVSETVDEKIWHWDLLEKNAKKRF